MFEYHVAKNGSDKNDGSLESPFLTINHAASLAQAGDKVVVHEGVYREWVNPKHSGRSNLRRITFEAAEGEKVVIKGSEEVKGWEHVKDGVWKTVISNHLFKGYNPFAEKLFGDWIEYNPGRHLGDVYLNGRSFYEAETYDELFDTTEKHETLDHWTNKIVKVQAPDQTKYKWFAEVGTEETVLYANFNDFDPNEELVEINVRKHVFYPSQTAINYITVRGFELAQAATQWAPPTADQPGLIGTHWSKGWIIEDNIIHDAKCSAVSMGKEISTGHNFSAIRNDKPGYQYQLEAVMLAEKSGWSREKIGSHIIRNNTIFDCGQNGIVGHLGCVFSKIYGNHIYNIGIKREFYGHEIGGIKLHAAIDVQIYENHIHDCSLGTWLDWQVQGTRVSRNVYYSNARDLFIEVTSGPHLVDNNILTADYAYDNHAQGGAYVNNLFAGEMILRSMLDRATPYHYPHSTLVAGFAPVYTGDDRFYNNLFVGKAELEGVGTAHFDDYPGSTEEYYDEVLVNDELGDHRRFHETKQAVYIDNNAYLGSAKAFKKEKNNYINADSQADVTIVNKEDGVYLEMTLPEELVEFYGSIQDSTTLIPVRIVDADFENADGSPVVIDYDFHNAKREAESAVGPFAELKAGKNSIKVWG